MDKLRICQKERRKRRREAEERKHVTRSSLDVYDGEREARNLKTERVCFLEVPKLRASTILALLWLSWNNSRGTAGSWEVGKTGFGRRSTWTSSFPLLISDLLFAAIHPGGFLTSLLSRLVDLLPDVSYKELHQELLKALEDLEAIGLPSIPQSPHCFLARFLGVLPTRPADGADVLETAVLCCTLASQGALPCEEWERLPVEKLGNTTVFSASQDLSTCFTAFWSS